VLALQDAVGGTAANLSAELLRCRRVLRDRNHSRDTAWVNLEVRALQLEGRLALMANPTKRRHVATHPVRPPHRMRFVRVIYEPKNDGPPETGGLYQPNCAKKFFMS
jgi:hypothetical protein